MVKDPRTILQDPLREVTRKVRRALLGVATIGLAVILLRLDPTKISALGLTFSGIDQNNLLCLWGWVVIYFLAVFLFYAASDLISWLVTMVDPSLKKELEDYQRPSAEQQAIEEARKDPDPAGSGLLKNVAAEMAGEERDNERREALGTWEQLCHTHYFRSKVIANIRVLLDVVIPVAVGVVAACFLLYTAGSIVPWSW